MEELYSTEMLDREILEDARKKAFKILKTADDTVASQSEQWETKTRQTVRELRDSHESRLHKARAEISARGPLDKRRLRSETAEFFLKETLAEFIKNYNREKMFLLLKKELAERLVECSDEIDNDKNTEITCRNINREEFEKTLRGIFALHGITNQPSFESPQSGPEGEMSFPAISINTPHLHITVSVEDITNNLLREKRAELVSCLLGPEALND